MPKAQADEFFYVLKEPLRILLVDDDPILREFGVVHLASDVAEVKTVAGGAAAFEILDTEPVDVVLLDLEMPEMDGFDVLHRLRNQPRTAELPVIVITGREDVAAIDRAFEAGATSFIVKPINWRLLSYQIRYVRRAWTAEKTLSRTHDHARTGGARTSGALLELARESRRFLQTALRESPQLRQAASHYAAALERLSAAALAAEDG